MSTRLLSRGSSFPSPDVSPSVVTTCLVGVIRRVCVGDNLPPTILSQHQKGARQILEVEPRTTFLLRLLSFFVCDCVDKEVTRLSRQWSNDGFMTQWPNRQTVEGFRGRDGLVQDCIYIWVIALSGTDPLVPIIAMSIFSHSVNAIIITSPSDDHHQSFPAMLLRDSSIDGVSSSACPDYPGGHTFQIRSSDHLDLPSLTMWCFLGGWFVGFLLCCCWQSYCARWDTLMTMTVVVVPTSRRGLMTMMNIL